MNQYDAFVSALNDFVHTWLYAYKNIELVYACIEGEEFVDGTACPDRDYMYILWADGRQSRVYISESSTREILLDFLNKKYEDVPEDEYI